MRLFLVALQFLTRLPVRLQGFEPAWLNDCVRHFPLVGVLVGAIGATMLMLGLIYGGWMLITGVIALILTLVGWLVDARREYLKVQEADVTGHLDSLPAPRPPRLLPSDTAD